MNRDLTLLSSRRSPLFVEQDNKCHVCTVTIVEHRVCDCNYLICRSCISKLSVIECGQCRKSERLVAFIEEHKIRVRGKIREAESEEEDDSNEQQDETPSPAPRRSSRHPPSSAVAAAVAEEETLNDGETVNDGDTQYDTVNDGEQKEDDVRAPIPDVVEQLLPSVAAPTSPASAESPTTPQKGSAQKAVSATPKKTREEIHEMLAECEKKSNEKTLDELFADLTLAITDSTTHVGKSDARSMDLPSVISEVVHITVFLKKSKIVMMRLRIRLGELYNRIFELFAIKGERYILEIPIAMEGGGFAVQRRLFSSAASYITERFQMNTADIYYCRRLSDACSKFPALISSEKTWSWFKIAMKEDVLSKEIDAYLAKIPVERGQQD